MFTKRTILSILLVILLGCVGTWGLAPTGRAEERGHSSGGLSPEDVNTVLDQAEKTANRTTSALRSLRKEEPRTTKMHIAVVDREGRLLGLRSMEDAWVGSLDIAIAKARTAAFFSSNENALTSRTIGKLSQAHDPETGRGPAGPLWGIGHSNQVGISGGPETRNGIITFPGGVPLYKKGQLVGGVGVSGDGVDQDETVALAGMVGFEPPPDVARLDLP